MTNVERLCDETQSRCILYLLCSQTCCANVLHVIPGVEWLENTIVFSLNVDACLVCACLFTLMFFRMQTQKIEMLILTFGMLPPWGLQFLCGMNQSADIFCACLATSSCHIRTLPTTTLCSGCHRLYLEHIVRRVSGTAQIHKSECSLTDSATLRVNVCLQWILCGRRMACRQKSLSSCKLTVLMLACFIFRSVCFFFFVQVCSSSELWVRRNCDEDKSQGPWCCRRV